MISNRAQVLSNKVWGTDQTLAQLFASGTPMVDCQNSDIYMQSVGVKHILVGPAIIKTYIDYLDIIMCMKRKNC